MKTEETLPIVNPNWSETQNKEFKVLLQGVADGYYWYCEGWDTWHDELLPQAIKALNIWLTFNTISGNDAVKEQTGNS